jgi:hypothetical protein
VVQVVVQHGAEAAGAQQREVVVVEGVADEAAATPSGLREGVQDRLAPPIE